MLSSLSSSWICSSGTASYLAPAMPILPVVDPLSLMLLPADDGGQESQRQEQDGPCPEFGEVIPARKVLSFGQEVFLGKFEGRGPNRPGMLAAGIKVVEDHGAEVVSAWGTVGENGEGRIEVLFAGTSLEQVRLRGCAKQPLEGMSARVYQIHCPNPATVVATVLDYRRLEGDLTMILANLSCDVIQTFSSVSLLDQANGKQLSHSFACLVSRPSCLATTTIITRLSPVARAHRGIAMAYDGCLKLSDEWRCW